MIKEITMQRFVVLILFMLICSPVIASDYHVLSISPNGRSANVVFHIPIPDVNNSVSYSLRSALSERENGANFISQVPWVLEVQEQTDLENGVLFEHVESVKFLALDTNLQKQTKIDNRFTALSITVVNKIQAILKFWHLDRSVP